MSYKVSLSPNAVKELNQSIDWYNEQKAGLGKRFYSKVSTTIKTIKKNPYAFELRLKEFRIVPVKVFPFVLVYFVVEPKEIIITAVFHTSRNPDEAMQNARYYFRSSEEYAATP